MAKRRLIVHVGLPKTGSTAMQTFLADNRVALSARGVLFPESFAHPRNGHFDLAHLFGETPRGAQVESDIADLEAEIAGFGGDTVILSSESFSSIPRPGKFAELADRLALAPTIVAYLRDQPEFAVSLYAQRVKTGLTTETFEDYAATIADNPHFDYPRVLAPWERFFSQVVVRLFPAPGGTIAEDFFSALEIEIDPATLPQAIGNANRRPGTREIEALRRFALELEERGFERSERPVLMRKFRASLKGGGGRFAPMDRRLAAEIRSRFAASNRIVAERYFDRKELFGQD